jgi:GNAT superfamily N-acetyltransferase
MTTTIVPFTAEYLDAAAVLLAARHSDDRREFPELPQRFEDPTLARPVLEALVAEPDMAGVVALCGETPAGFMLGAPVFVAATETWAGFSWPRSAIVPFTAHAAEREARAQLYPRMYAALGEGWLRAGINAHSGWVPTDRESTEVWSDLGFGRFIDLAVRDTSVPVTAGNGNAMAIDARRAEPEDAELVQALVTDFFRSFADPPIFVPFLPETSADRRRFVTEHLNDPACSFWLAFVDSRPVGMQLFVEPKSPHWDLSALETPDRSIYLHFAYTASDARSAGIGAALVRRTLAWARETGYDYCAAHYVTASRAAAFWRGLGFRPISRWLSRVVDERAIWAHGRD